MLLHSKLSFCSNDTIHNCWLSEKSSQIYTRNCRLLNNFIWYPSEMMKRLQIWSCDSENPHRISRKRHRSAVGTGLVPVVYLYCNSIINIFHWLQFSRFQVYRNIYGYCFFFGISIPHPANIVWGGGYIGICLSVCPDQLPHLLSDFHPTLWKLRSWCVNFAI